MKIEFDFDGIEEFEADLLKEEDGVIAALHLGVVRAGNEGIEAMRTSHPYQDHTFLLTDGMYCRLFGRQTRTQAGAIIRFAAPYANIVNDGSVKSKPYPFVPTGMYVAELSLERCAIDALEIFCQRVGSR